MANSTTEASKSSDSAPLTTKVSSEFTLVVLIATFLFILALSPLRNGQFIPGPFISGLLYGLFARAIFRNTPGAISRQWVFAALPVILIPAGMILFAGTFFIINSLRKKSAKLNAAASIEGDARKSIINVKAAD